MAAENGFGPPLRSPRAHEKSKKALFRRAVSDEVFTFAMCPVVARAFAGLVAG
jgi:hypothetical protein